MRILKFLICSLVVSSILACGHSKSSTDNFDWLIGDWKRTNDSEGQQTHEIWEKLNEKEYIGLGCTLEESDTVFKENLKMVNKEGQWWFEVRGVNKGVTSFKVTAIKPLYFAAENESNPFPKKIAYRKKGDQLNAVVSADENVIEFSFRKRK